MVVLAVDEGCSVQVNVPFGFVEYLGFSRGIARVEYISLLGSEEVPYNIKD